LFNNILIFLSRKLWQGCTFSIRPIDPIKRPPWLNLKKDKFDIKTLKKLQDIAICGDRKATCGFALKILINFEMRKKINAVWILLNYFQYDSKTKTIKNIRNG
jgi:hypothetical protein